MRALFGYATFTTPTRPNPEITVMFARIPDEVPASMVIVCENEVLEP